MNKELTELLINVQEKARTLEQELEKTKKLLSSKTNKIMEEEYQLNIDEVLYLQMIIQQNLNDEYTEDDEVYRNMIIKLQNKICLIKNELNK
jgi:hypothetical protein